MSDNINIELQDESSSTPSNQMVLPANIMLVGEIENDDIKVYIKQDVYKSLEKYALADTNHERGTIVLGDYCEDLDHVHVIISNYIEAKYTDSSVSTLTFTHETWDYVSKEHESKYKDKRIVGWQHTHPNYGIFLSNYDLFIHENFFNLPFQVAYVIDPINNTRGFFQWKNGKIEKLRGFYIYDDIGKPIKIEQSSKKEQAKKQADHSNIIKPLTIISILLTLVTIVLSFSVIALWKNEKEQMIEQKALEDSIIIQKDIIEKQSESIEHLKEEINKNKINNDNVRLISYSVEPGDTLLSICEKNSVDYYTNRNIILSINGIDNPNKIFVGERILLPIESTN